MDCLFKIPLSLMIQWHLGNLGFPYQLDEQISCFVEQSNDKLSVGWLSIRQSNTCGLTEVSFPQCSLGISTTVVLFFNL